MPVESKDFDRYLSIFSTVFKKAKLAIKTYDRSANIVTTDIAGINISTDVNYLLWSRFTNKINNYVDSLSFNAYPGTNDEVIEKMAGEIPKLKALYKKPVYITETGMCRV